LNPLELGKPERRVKKNQEIRGTHDRGIKGLHGGEGPGGKKKKNVYDRAHERTSNQWKQGLTRKLDAAAGGKRRGVKK